jgi:serine carboxypeptidase-like clade 1
VCVAAVAGLNLYDVLQPCYHGRNPYRSAAELGAALATYRRWPALGGLRNGPVAGWVELLGQLGHTPPCLDSREMWAFANDPAVRQAIHAEPIDKIGAFDECTNGARISYTHDAGSMLPVHRYLIEKGLTAMVFSGDHDMAVPHTGSEAWTSWLGRQLGVERPWAPWHTGDRQVAGYAVHYRGLVYATVRGAGHMVPESKPAEALHLFARFLAAGSL